MPPQHPISTPEQEQVALMHAVRRVRSVLLGVVVGFTAGLALFIATAVLLLKGGDNVGAHLVLLGQFFPGYTMSWLGAVIGFLYAYVVGFGVGWLVGWIYNSILALRRR